MCEVLRMTRLAPDIIRAILDGRQPRHLNLHAMRGRQGEVPLDWEEQRGKFGFPGGRSNNPILVVDPVWGNPISDDFSIAESVQDDISPA